MYEPADAKNMAELVEHLREYSYDRFDILTLYDAGELPKFIYDGNELADEVLGTTLDEDMEEANYSPDRPHFWSGVLAVVIVLVLLFN